jgi:hypothetical protein
VPEEEGHEKYRNKNWEVRRKKVNKSKLITTLSLLSVVMLAMMTVPAQAYDINGDLTDWGLGEWYKGLNNGPAGYWVPDSPTAYFVVEDNRDPDLTSYSEYFWPNYKDIFGVHIEGQGSLDKYGSSYTDYDELPIMGHAQPAGGEICDIEALYFDSDPSTAYFAIITSVPEEQMGDLKIILAGDTYGIVLQGTDMGEVYKGDNDNWVKCANDYNPGWPAQPLDTGADFRVDLDDPGTYMGNAVVAYVDSGHDDNNHTYSWGFFDGKNYIIEVSVPRTALDLNPSGGVLDLYATLWCGNDQIEIGQVRYSEIPEFTTIALPVCMIFGLFYYYRRKRQNSEEKHE